PPMTTTSAPPLPLPELMGERLLGMLPRPSGEDLVARGGAALTPGCVIQPLRGKGRRPLGLYGEGVGYRSPGSTQRHPGLLLLPTAGRLLVRRAGRAEQLRQGLQLRRREVPELPGVALAHGPGQLV